MPANHDAAADHAAVAPGGDASTDGDADAAEPMNRAERRAKGKAKQQPRLSVGRIDPRQPGGAQARRQYSNRRSGGGG